MTLKQKLLSCLGLLAAATVLIVGASYWSTKNNAEALATILNDRVVPMSDLKVTVDSYAVDIVDAAHKARNGNVSFAEAETTVRNGKSKIAAAWQRYRSTTLTDEEVRLVSAAESQMQRADVQVARLIQILAARDRAALDRFVVNDLYRSIDPVSTEIGKLLDLQINVASEVTSDALSALEAALIMVLVLALGAGVALAIAYLTITRKVVAPINMLADIINGLAKSSGDAKLPNLDQRDEIGTIARAVDAFLASVIAKERVAAAAAAAEQTVVTGALRQSLASLTAGDLTSPIVADFPPAYAELKTNFNEALHSLRSLIGSVAQSASSIRTGSGEIAQASESLARRTESNAANLEEASAAIAQIDGRLKASVVAATSTVQRADGAIATVADSRSVAVEAVQAMGRVSETAKGIDSVIEGLDKIAFQTRVLAMNAAVEAGRAGDAGRGFAVVADLVSALAMRAEEEAKRAREQLTVTQTEIGAAVEAVHKVDGALANISGDVGEVHVLLASMAADNAAQSSTIAEIAGAIGAMDNSTQQNAAMVEETSAAARNLSSEVEALADEANRFKIDAPGALRAGASHSAMKKPKTAAYA
ncbi:HAMP domain-containing methyl-accepting chemotaxis protein [Blastomonas aquatica]|uniref:Methyl-accepting chemotaxis protein n=1 Tax=Blastomonas aquatica TaxID=1510276 RepID=A0ABQ1JRA0_9SPHN|nr:methyl-accepting chemotaxis protein [Blastomonas aquatica]GGB73067.1 methyl-accepting chemotaxis protein [Blastomonas aquatica]